jgi:hypothetical protein
MAKECYFDVAPCQPRYRVGRLNKKLDLRVMPTEEKDYAAIASASDTLLH